MREPMIQPLVKEVNYNNYDIYYPIYAVVGFKHDRAKALKCIDDIIHGMNGVRIVSRISTSDGMRIEFADHTILKWIKDYTKIDRELYDMIWCDSSINLDYATLTKYIRNKENNLIWVS